MATDKSEPRIGLIIKVALVVIATLLILRAVLTSYFDQLLQAEQNRKIVAAKPEALTSLRAEEQDRLRNGPLPIDQAMHELATKGRGPDFMPVVSRDIAPLQGWVRMPVQAPSLMIAASQDAGASSGAPGATADAGPSAPSTVGTTAPRVLDAGASKKKP
jgi:hypothetical protein